MEVGRIALLFCLVALVTADTPANCTYEDVRGEWIFQIGEGGHERTLNCSNFGSAAGNSLSFVAFIFSVIMRS